MAIPKLPLPIEMKVVALIARGDRYPDIRDTIETEFGRRISAGVITYIKKRNSESLSIIKDAIVQKEKDDAQGLLERSHRLMGKKLRQAEEDEDAFDNLKPTDLVSISKEMFHQVRAEQGLGESQQQLIDPKEKLKELQAVLEENDEIRLERIVFAKREQTSEVHTPPVSDGGVSGSEHGGVTQQQGLPAGDNTNRQEDQADQET